MSQHLVINHYNESVKRIIKLNSHSILKQKLSEKSMNNLSNITSIDVYLSNKTKRDITHFSIIKN